MMELTVEDTFCVEKLPTRSNICYYFNYIDKNLELETVFKDLIEEVKEMKHNAKRTIIFCQTRKQCSLIYRMFHLVLGNNMFAYGTQDPTMRVVDMFHAGSPTSVKEHILSQMGSLESHLRVVICTIAFGMGIDCKDTYRSIHFGPPKTVEFLVQESGRIGRDGNQCFSYVLYNGLLSSHCNQQMKQLIQIRSCRRELVLNLFGVNKNEIQVSKEKCTCCDNCALICQCGDCCRTMHFGKNAEVTVQSIPAKLRPVSDSQRQQLHQNLLAYRKSLFPKSVAEFMPVGPPNIFFEFGQFQIEQVLSNCQQLFTLDDILEHVEIWRNIHAHNVFLALHETFGDMNEDVPHLLEEEFQEMEVVATDWEYVRDDSTLIDLQDTICSQFETSVENSLAQSETSENANMSGVFASLAGAANDYISKCS